MDKFFVNIYKYLANKRWLVYSIITVTLAIFVYFGSQLEYEEDISKLLPQTDEKSYSGLAFSDLKVKDKIFVQLTSKKGASKTNPIEMSVLCDELMEQMTYADTTNNFISNSLYKIDDDLMINILDYAIAYLPTLIDTTLYSTFDQLLTEESIAYRMKNNYKLLFDEGRDDLLNLIQQDPAGLRYAFIENGYAEKLQGTGFTIINNHLFSPDSTVALAFISPNLSSLDSKAGTKLVEEMETVRYNFEKNHPNIEVYFHGATFQSVFNSRQIKKDLMMTIGVSLVIICIIIGISFKNRNTLLLLLSPVVYGALFAMACVYWIKGSMSLMAMGIGAIVLGVALSYVLHVLTHYKYVSDPERVIKEQAIPVCLGCLTTIGAFAGLLLTKSSLLQDFGIFASFALIGTTLFSLIFLPHLFSPTKNKKSDRAFAIINKINSLPLDRNKYFIGVIIIISCICFYTSSWVTFDSDLKNIGYTDERVEHSQKLYAEKNNKGFKSQYYASTSETLNEAIEFNKKLIAKAEYLKEKGDIDSYSQMSSILISEKEQRERIEKWNNYWTTEKVERVMNTINKEGDKVGFKKGTFDMFEILITADYEPGSLYDMQILPDGLMSNIVEETNGQYMVFTSVLMPQEYHKKVNDQMASVNNTVVIDPFYYTNNMVEIMHNDFNMVLSISSIFVLIVLLLSYRSISRTLLAFMPMFLSWYIVQGIMGIFGLQFNLINIIISSFIFGIGVDYSIFIMDGLLANTRRDDVTLLLYHKTAILLSAFVLIVVVGSLMFATHPAIKSIGISTLIGMSATVIIAYTLQPFLFRQLMKSKYFHHKFDKKPRFKR